MDWPGEKPESCPGGLLHKAESLEVKVSDSMIVFILEEITTGNNEE